MSAWPISRVDPADVLQARTDVDLTGLNSFGCPCVASQFVTISNAQPGTLQAVAHWLRDKPDALILGGGSNLLMAAPRLNAVAHLGIVGRQHLPASSNPADSQQHDVLVRAGAAEIWHPFVQWTLAQGWYGLENLSLIPGTVGAAPVQNIGAYGVELDCLIDGVEAFDRLSGKPVLLTPAECGFAYRDSAFKQAPDRWLITAVRFRLSTKPKLMLDYGQIRDELAAQKVLSPQPADVARAVIKIRKRKLPDPTVLGNAGSFFKNPIIDAREATQLQARYPTMPLYPATTGKKKVAAGWLIEQCGFKGKRLGDAGVHEAHALVLVNHGQASGREILALAHMIVSAVSQAFGIELEPEPRVIEHA
ncbi:MAG: UDP-N-acetylmuramate dehydrogenase [Burkholderiaceae bacterium]